MIKIFSCRSCAARWRRAGRQLQPAAHIVWVRQPAAPGSHNYVTTLLKNNQQTKYFIN